MPPSRLKPGRLKPGFVKSRCVKPAVFTCALALVSSAALAGWTEAVNGDLSNENESPTPVSLALGNNLITGRMGVDPLAGVLDADIFTFTVPADATLTAIDLTVYVPSLVLGNGAFLAISSGTTIDSGEPNAHLSNLLVDAVGPLLPLLATPTFGGTGIPGPLGPGTYTLWFQETITTVDYQFNLVLTPIPEPATAIPAAVALTALAARRRR